MTPPHHTPDLRQALTRSVAEECGAARAVPFDPDARSFEAFKFYGLSTRLLDPLAATSLNQALAETTGRWAWDRGDRLGVREIGVNVDRLHVYAVRRSAQGFRRDWTSNLEYARSLEGICTVDLNIIAGIDVIGVGVERDLFERRQRQRPEGARRGTRP